MSANGAQKVYVVSQQDAAPEAVFATIAGAIGYCRKRGLYQAPVGASWFDDAHDGYPDIFEMEMSA